MRVIVGVVVALVLSGCGGESTEAKNQKSGEPTTPATTTSVQPANEGADEPTDQKPITLAALDGTPQPADLSNVRCVRGEEGRWEASGTAQNSTKKDGTYQVTVFLGQADGKAAEATTKYLGEVGAGASIDFAFQKLPKAAAESTCFVQLRRSNSARS